MKPLLIALGLLAFVGPANAQVHYHKDGNPWKQRARRGPDAEVDGWYYNLGITGIRVELVADSPKELIVRHVFEGSPAHKKVKVGDSIIGAGGKRFREEHKNGYGMDKFGPDGPIFEFAEALEKAQAKSEKGKLKLTLRRGGGVEKVELKVGTRYGTFGKKFPEDCEKTDLILDELYEYLVEHQREDGSWGSVPQNTFAPLALLASGERKYMDAVEKCVRQHARTTKVEDDSWLINWRYMAAAIVMGEYYLATGEKWVKDELQEVYDFLCTTQYTDLSQVNPKVKESHPDSWPKDAMKQHGGWGHNPGFEGYGPIAMITAQGTLAFSMLSHCGIEVDRERHDAAYAFVARGTGANGYVWYGDDAAGDQDWADMGRTGAAGIGNHLSPYKGGEYKARADQHAKIIGLHPESFPDTHGSPIMGMGYAAATANITPGAWRSLMDANRWWFTLAQCTDGSYYYQPNRDNAGYGNDARIAASAVTAFILSIPKKSLLLTGKPQKKMKQHMLGRDKDPKRASDLGGTTLKMRKASWSLLTKPGMRNMARLAFPASTITHGESEGSVAFTVDDGFCGLDNPDGCMLEEVRALFKEHDAQATFFVTGSHCEHTSAEDIAKLLADGHELANHSMRDHPYTDASPEEFAADLEETAAILAKHQPEPSPWYRAPFGRLNKKMQAVLDERGLTHVVSDAFANDTEIPDAEWVADFVLKNTKPGSILLIHMPERGRREWNFEAMRLTLEGLKERGLSVTTLSALLKD